MAGSGGKDLDAYVGKQKNSSQVQTSVTCSSILGRYAQIGSFVERNCMQLRHNWRLEDLKNPNCPDIRDLRFLRHNILLRKDR